MVYLDCLGRIVLADVEVGATDQLKGRLLYNSCWRRSEERVDTKPKAASVPMVDEAAVVPSVPLDCCAHRAAQSASQHENCCG